MTEREHQTPERPTPHAIFQAIQAERAGLSASEYVRALRDKYDGSKVMYQARVVRDGYRTMPWVGEGPADARMIRTAFIDGFVVGYHVARKSIPESAQRRAAMADAFYGMIQGILSEVSTKDMSAGEVNATIIGYLGSIVEEKVEQGAPAYYEEFSRLADDLVRVPAHVEYARLGYGVAISLGMIAQNAGMDGSEGSDD